MAWIKRNLYFLVGTAIAVALLGLAGYYCYSKWTLNKANDEQLTSAYEDWKRIINLPVGPGNDKVDNIKIAREEQEKVRQMIQRLRGHFVPIQPIPNPANGTVSSLEFQRVLGTTISQMTRDAANSGVRLQQTNYYFSFQAERDQVNFEPGSLGPLSERLGHIRFICDVLFKAKINSLLSVRRERVSLFDNQSVTDYIDIPSVTNDLAVLVPYEVRLECFSAELGEVLAAFANRSNGIIIKAINVERSPDPVASAGSAQAEPTRYQYAVVQPQFAGQAPYTPYAPRRGYVQPRGSGPAYDPYNRGASPYLQPPMSAPTPARPTTTNVLDERPLTVTLVLNVVKMLPKK